MKVPGQWLAHIRCSEMLIFHFLLPKSINTVNNFVIIYSKEVKRRLDNIGMSFIELCRKLQFDMFQVYSPQINGEKDKGNLDTCPWMTWEDTYLSITGDKSVARRDYFICTEWHLRRGNGIVPLLYNIGLHVLSSLLIYLLLTVITFFFSASFSMLLLFCQILHDL